MKSNSEDQNKSPRVFPLELFFSALNAAVDTIVIADKFDRIIWVNSAFEKLTGYTYREVIGKNTSILKSTRQSDEFYENLWDTVNSANVWQGELWNRRKNGEEYLEEQTITPVVDDGQNITHFIAIKRDITEIVAIRRQLKHAQKMEAIGQLTGGVSHNFNNKLASILGYSELAIEMSAKLASATLNRYLGKIMTAANEAKDLVSQMQTFCREQPMPYRALSLVEVTRATIKLVIASIPSSVELSVSISDELALVESDPAQFQQMIMILVYNAVNAMSGQGQLSIDLKQVRVRDAVCNGCHASVSGSFVELSLTDTGQGISEANMPKLFLPFFSTHQMDGGTGMGLSVLHGMLHEQKGHVLVSSELHHGSVFKLLFPIVERQKLTAENSAQTHSSETSLGKQSARILVVDDEPAVANFLADLLTLEGYQVTVEIQVQAALSQFIKQPQTIDLVVTDQTMAGLSGLDFIRAIKNIRPELPAILISGKRVEDFDISFKSGKLVDAFLCKPFRGKQLTDLVSRLLESDC